MTRFLCALVSFPHGTSVGIFFFLQNLPSISRSHSAEPPFHALTAPWAIVFCGSGITLSQSVRITRPKPLHASHAPSGELYEKSAVRAGSKLRAHDGQTRPRPTGWWRASL